jgi:hypothetical protein
MLLMMSENIPQNIYSSQRIINYPTQLYLVGHFRILYYIMTHGNMNIKIIFISSPFYTYCSSFLTSDSPYILLICSPLYCETDIAHVITNVEFLQEKLKGIKFLSCHKKLKQMSNKGVTSLDYLSRKINFSTLFSYLTHENQSPTPNRSLTDNQ